MSIKERMKGLVKEAEIYRSQSLLDQSRDKYSELLNLVESNESTSKNEKLINDIKGKIKEVEDEITEIDQATESPELTEDVQNLISNLFSYSKNQAMAEIEGAVALAKFGQYDKAVKELERLIKAGPLSLQAAVNLIRCHLSLATPEAAINQYKRWASREEFGKGDMRYIRNFLESQLKKRGIDPRVSEIGEDVPEEDTEEPSEDLLDFSTIDIELTDGPYKGKKFEFDVSFQSGNIVSIIIPSMDKSLADELNIDFRFSKIRCLSDLGIFDSSGYVSGKAKIETGKKRGSYAIDITIEAQ